MNNNINVEIGSLKTAASTILQKIEEIKTDITNAQTAGDNALDALGGSGTPAGGAVNSKMIAINDDEFEKTTKSIQNFLESITAVSDTYTKAEQEFVDLINKYSNDQD